MPPLDWERIMGADVVALREDLDAADNMYDILEMVNYKTIINICIVTCTFFDCLIHMVDVFCLFSRGRSVQILQKLLMSTK